MLRALIAAATRPINRAPITILRTRSLVMPNHRIEAMQPSSLSAPLWLCRAAATSTRARSSNDTRSPRDQHRSPTRTPSSSSSRTRSRSPSSASSRSTKFVASHRSYSRTGAPSRQTDSTFKFDAPPRARRTDQPTRSAPARASSNTATRTPTRRPSSTASAAPTNKATTATSSAHQDSEVVSALADKRSDKSWSSLGLSRELQAFANEAHLPAPTTIQARSFAAMMQGRSLLLAAPTGSGKTLAYVLPLMQQLKEHEASDSTFVSRPDRPRAIILVPSRELALQVTEVCKLVAKHAKLRVRSIIGGRRKRLQTDSLESGVDLIIATPGRLQQLKDAGDVFYSELRHLVIDEADSMFGKGSIEDTRAVLGPIHGLIAKGTREVQLVAVTATINSKTRSTLMTEFGELEELTTPQTNRSHSVTHKFVHVKRALGQDKQELLLELLNKTIAQGKRAIVFCKTIPSCRSTDHFLTEHNIKTACLHGGIPPIKRQQFWEQFLAEKDSVLVCTDVASRGLDTTMVDHVINFDFPMDGADYLHRAGRTGRVRPGVVTNLLDARNRGVALELERRLRDGADLAPSFDRST